MGNPTIYIGGESVVKLMAVCCVGLPTVPVLQGCGRRLLEVARSCPRCQTLVLCGHTHGGGKLRVLENRGVLTDPAEYEKPQVQ